MDEETQKMVKEAMEREVPELINRHAGANGLDMVGDNTVFCDCANPTSLANDTGEPHGACLNCKLQFGYGPPANVVIVKKPVPPFPPTPVCDLWAAKAEERETILCFWDWMCGKRFLLYQPHTSDSGWESFIPVEKTGDELVAEYMGIDLKELENERRALLDAVRLANQKESEKT